jgi:hypothetical protein
MEQLHSGDEVLALDPATGQLTYTIMYLDSHFNTSVIGNYLAITTSPSTITIKVSPEHFMYRRAGKSSSNSANTTGLASTGNPWLQALFDTGYVAVGAYDAEIVLASKIRPGDLVFITPSSHERRTLLQVPEASCNGGPASAAPSASMLGEIVTSVVHVTERGRHAPKTYTGNIIVDGVLAHCHTVVSPMIIFGRTKSVQWLFSQLPDSINAWFGQHVGLFPALQWLHGAVPDWFENRVAAMSARVGGYAELPLGKRWGLVAEGVSLAAARNLRGCAAALMKPMMGVVTHLGNVRPAVH